MTETTIQVSNTDVRIADIFDAYSKEQVAIIKNTVAKGTTNTELALFLFTAQSANLNPLTKEIWCYKDNKNNLIIFTGRDGFLKRAQQQPAYNGLRSCEVRAGDGFEIDVPNGKVTHKITKPLKERGEIIGAYCFVFRKDGEATLEWVEWETYAKNFSASPWKTHSAEMIKKVAEAQRGVSKPCTMTAKQRAARAEKVSVAQRGVARPQTSGAKNGMARPIVNLDTGEVFSCIPEALQKYPKASNISSVCRGKRNIAGGYRWAYA